MRVKVRLINRAVMNRDEIPDCLSWQPFRAKDGFVKYQAYHIKSDIKDLGNAYKRIMKLIEQKEDFQCWF